MAAKKEKKCWRVKLGGKVWRVRIATKPMPGSWGFCDCHTRDIAICPTADAAGKLRETLIHETIHALFPVLDEDVVKEAAVEIDDVLDAVGL